MKCVEKPANINLRFEMNGEKISEYSSILNIFSGNTFEISLNKKDISQSITNFTKSGHAKLYQLKSEIKVNFLRG